MTTCPVCASKQPVATKGRSLDQHRRYFAVINAAFAQWPEREDFQSADELRKYLQVRAGAGDVVAEIKVAELGGEIARHIAMAAMRAADGYAVPIVRGDCLRIVKPRSVAWDKMRHEDFCKLSDAVCDLIERKLGVAADDLIRETEAAA